MFCFYLIIRAIPTLICLCKKYVDVNAISSFNETFIQTAFSFCGILFSQYHVLFLFQWPIRRAKMLFDSIPCAFDTLYILYIYLADFVYVLLFPSFLFVSHLIVTFALNKTQICTGWPWIGFLYNWQQII